MIIRCTKCSTEFALDPSQVGAEGVTLRCSVCSPMCHAEPDPEAIPAPWKVQTTDRHSLSFPDLRRVLEHLADGRLKPDDQLSHTGTNWIRLAEVPEFSSLFIGVEGHPRVFKAVQSSGLPDLPSAHGDDVRREETVRVRVQNVLHGYVVARGPRAGAAGPKDCTVKSATQRTGSARDGTGTSTAADSSIPQANRGVSAGSTLRGR